jgi:Bacterial dnaA  protein
MQADRVPYLILDPDLEARLAILRKTAAKIQITLPSDVTLYLTRNVRPAESALEGALVRLMVHSSVTGTEITVKYTQQVLANFIAAEARKVRVDSVQQLPSLGSGRKALGTKEARIKRREPSAEVCNFDFCLVKIRHGRKSIQVRQELEVNMRESERERLARRDGYERELERRAKKRKQA